MTRINVYNNVVVVVPHKYSHTYTLRLECICCTLTHNIYTAHSFYETYSTVQLQLHTRVTLHAWFHATFYMWNVNISCVNHYLHETRMRKFTQNRKCHNTTSVITWHKKYQIQDTWLWLHTKKSMRIIAQATRWYGCTVNCIRSYTVLSVYLYCLLQV